MEEIVFAAVDKTKDYVIPSKDDGNAGFDMYASFEEDYVVIEPLTTKLINTNIAYSIPDNYYFQVEERGSTGSKGIKKSAGVCDPSYNGSIFIALTNCNNKPVVITKEEDTSALEDDYIVYPYKKAIAQIVLQRYDNLPVRESDYSEILAKPTERGSGALGSSGK